MQKHALPNEHVFWNLRMKKKTSFAAVSPAEYKKARQEIKKRSSDTLKLQKKAKKGLKSPSMFVYQLNGKNM